MQSSISTALGLTCLTIVGACSQPENHSGKWLIAAECSGTSQLGEMTVIAEALVVETEPGVYVGTITNNIGDRGTLSATQGGREIEIKTVWQNENTTDAHLTYDSKSNAFSGTDSFGCSLSVAKT